MLWKSESVNWSELEALPIITENQQKAWMVRIALLVVVFCAASALAQVQPQASKSQTPERAGQAPDFGEEKRGGTATDWMNRSPYMMYPSVPPGGYDQVIKDLTTIIEKQQNLISKLEARIKELQKGSEPKP